MVHSNKYNETHEHAQGNQLQPPAASTTMSCYLNICNFRLNHLDARTRQVRAMRNTHIHTYVICAQVLQDLLNKILCKFNFNTSLYRDFTVYCLYIHSKHHNLPI